MKRTTRECRRRATLKTRLATLRFQYEIARPEERSGIMNSILAVDRRLRGMWGAPGRN